MAIFDSYLYVYQRVTPFFKSLVMEITNVGPPNRGNPATKKWHIVTPSRGASWPPKVLVQCCVFPFRGWSRRRLGKEVADPEASLLEVLWLWRFNLLEALACFASLVQFWSQYSILKLLNHPETKDWRRGPFTVTHVPSVFIASRYLLGIWGCVEIKYP